MHGVGNTACRKSLIKSTVNATTSIKKVLKPPLNKKILYILFYGSGGPGVTSSSSWSTKLAIQCQACNSNAVGLSGTTDAQEAIGTRDGTWVRGIQDTDLY